MTEEEPPPLPAEPPVEEEGRRYPSTIGGAFYLVVIAVVAISVGIVTTGNWRLGVRWFGGALIFEGRRPPALGSDDLRSFCKSTSAPVWKGDQPMYISSKASRIRQREAQGARGNRAEIVKARSIGQITRRDLIRWGIFTSSGLLVCKNGLSPFARSAFAAIPTGTPRSSTST